jgi:hypothetical protein
MRLIGTGGTEEEETKEETQKINEWPADSLTPLLNRFTGQNLRAPFITITFDVLL